ncbi:hypothetical protein C8Q74DRAFT_1373396 [Fomes fomentarius]|nr:hypothetical protein C8Q74DRAFT_1373396 [Fomes fomentarius]
MIFTGQPGIGKTTFLLYLLVLLLQRKQVVLLTLDPSKPSLLFYHNRSLFEANRELLPECAYQAPILFPVQAPSPNPALYKSWRKKPNPLLSAFPLWKREEFKQGLQLHKGLAHLQGELGSMLETWQDHIRDSSFTYSCALDLLRAACGDKRPESVDAAVDLLLEACITAFGYVARDVFRAIVGPGGYEDLLDTHEEASQLPYEKLEEIVKAVVGSNSLGKHVPHRVVCIRPRTNAGERVRWRIDFKSDMMAKKMSEKWADAQEGKVRELMAYLSTAPAGNTFVGWFFEALAHRRILAADGAQECWSLKPMTFREPSTFVLRISAASIPKIPKKHRLPVPFDTESITSEQLELRDDEYYIPNIANFPLIDSFLVTFEPGSSAAAPSADL